MAKVFYKNRRGTTDEWENSEVILEEGELGLEEYLFDSIVERVPIYEQVEQEDGTFKDGDIIDYETVTRKGTPHVRFKVGDGVHKFSELHYAPNDVYDDIKLLQAEVAKFTALNNKFNADNAKEQIDELVKVASEVYDAHVLSDGTTPTIQLEGEEPIMSLGTTIRDIDRRLRTLDSDLVEFKSAKAVDGLDYDEETSKLYLTANGGERVESSAVTIVSGSGGGGGGGGSSSVVKIGRVNSKNAFTVASEKPAEIDFYFESSEQELDQTFVSTGPGSYSITVNNVEVISSGVIENSFGLTSKIAKVLDLKSYLSTGTNTIKVRCTDSYGNYKTLNYSITVVSLVMEASFKDDKVFANDQPVTFTYDAIGEVAKTIYFKYKSATTEGAVWDNLVAPVTLAATASHSSISLPLNNLEHDVYYLKVYAQTNIEGIDDPIISNELNYTLLVKDHTGVNTTPLLALKTNELVIEEGLPLTLFYIVYGSTNPASISIDVEHFDLNEGAWVICNGLSETAQVDQTQHTKTISTYPVGKIRFVLKHEHVLTSTLYESTTPEVIVKESSVHIDAYDTNQILYLTAKNKNNTSDNKTEWTYGDVTTTFSNFNWSSNGWVTDDAGATCLRLSGDANAVINHQIFTNDFISQTHGHTLEIEFAVRNILDRSVRLLNTTQTKQVTKFEQEYVEKDGEIVLETVQKPVEEDIGLYITPDTLTFASDTTTTSCNFSEDERVRISIVVEPQNSTTHFISIYINGVISAIKQYQTSDTFELDPKKSASAGTIQIGSDKCDIDIYNIRSYNEALTPRQVLDNYIADLDSRAEQISLIAQNDIYNGSNLSYAAVKKLIPTVTFIGKMPQSKGDKKKDSVRMIFEDPFNPHLNFDEILKEIDVQGTSSAGYVRKNWKTKHHNLHQHMPGEIPAKVFCLKVDYAEATGTHNTQNANFVETLYSKFQVDGKTPIEALPPQLDALEFDGYNDGDGNPINYSDKVRSTITGFPIVIFHIDTDDSKIINMAKQELETISNDKVVFSSKGNFNYDKGAETVFGFDTDKYPSVECWEFCNNTSDPCNFKGPIALENWSSDFESRYPENLNPHNTKFKSLHDWVVSTDPEATIPEANITEANAASFALTAPYIVKKDVPKPVTYEVEVEESLVPGSDGELPYVFVRETYTINGKEQTETRNDTNRHELFDDEGNSVTEKTYTVERAYTEVVQEEVTYNYDTQEYRLAKFENEFEQHFNMHYTAIYYVYTFVALMVDQRAKNMFLTYWEKTEGDPTTGRWYPYFYDNDTCFGIDNNGVLTFDYYHEDNGIYGKIGGRNVYNGQNSVLWNNFRRCFSDVIESTYRELRSDNKLTKEKLLNQLITQGSDKYSPAIYNEDAEYKYITMARDNPPDTTNLIRLRGDGELHLRYFIENRIDYCDSKWVASDYLDNRIYLRINTPNAEGLVVPPNAKIETTTYSHTYAGVRYKGVSGGDVRLNLEQHRVGPGEKAIFGAELTENFNDTEAYIYGADKLTSVGDLSPLYCSYLDVSKAVKLSDLIVGNKTSGYVNNNLTSLELGANRLLRTINVCNCSKLSGALNLTDCDAIEYVYATGTNITAVNLPAAGNLKVLELPGSVSSLKITNQLSFEEDGLRVANYSNITSLYLANTNIDTKALLDNCVNATNSQLQRVHIANIQYDKTTNLWCFETGEDAVKALTTYAKYDGIDGLEVLNGVIFIKELTGEEYNKIHEMFKYLQIEFTKLTSTVSVYKDSNKGTPLATIEVVDPQFEGNPPSENGIELDEETVIAVVSKTDPTAFNDYSDVQYHYTRTGWATDDKAVNALTNIRGDRSIYATWDKVLRQYTVTYYRTGPAGNVYYGSVQCDYGTTSLPDPDGDPNIVPEYNSTNEQERTYYGFTGWLPALSVNNPLTGDIAVYAQYSILTDKVKYSDSSEFSETWDVVTADENEKTGWHSTGNNSLDVPQNPVYVALRKYKWVDNAINIPPSWEGVASANGAKTVIPVEIGDINETVAFMEPVSDGDVLILPETVTAIRGNTCLGKTGNNKTYYSLSNVNVPEGVTYLGAHAFANNAKLQHIQYDAAKNPVPFTGDYSNVSAFYNAGSGFSSTPELVITIGENVTDLPYAIFAKSKIKKINWEKSPNLKRVHTNAFTGATVCTELEDDPTGESLDKITTLRLPDSLERIEDYAFLQTHGFAHLVIPKVSYLGTSAFGGLQDLEVVTLPKSLSYNNYTSANVFTYALPKLRKFNLVDSSDGKQSTSTISDGKILCVTNIDGTNHILRAAQQCGQHEEGVGLVYSIPNNITSIRTYAFHAVSGIEHLRATAEQMRLSSVETYAFSSMPDLLTVDLSKATNLTRLTSSLFSGCNKLTDVKLPTSIDTVDGYILSGTQVTKLEVGISEYEPQKITLNQNTLGSIRSTKMYLRVYSDYLNSIAENNNYFTENATEFNDTTFKFLGAPNTCVDITVEFNDKTFTRGKGAEEQ